MSADLRVPGARPGPADQALRVAVAVAISLSTAEIVGGLIAPHGYTFGLVYGHALAVLAGCALALSGLGEADGCRSRLNAGCGMLVGVQAPWTLAALDVRPWFALLGLLGGTAAAVVLVVLDRSTRVAPAPATGHALRRRAARPAAVRGSRREATAPERGRAVAGWYPEPSGGAGWRWWDGRDWTEHRAASDA